jgi:hypothetical protein
MDDGTKSIFDNVREPVFFVVILLLLFALIIVSLTKLGIFFETFMFLQKKQNFDKANYMSNNSYFKYYYTNRLGGSIGIESVNSGALFLFTVIAFVGWYKYGYINHGYLNYYYGDTNEYYFIQIFIYFIIILMFFHIPSLVSSVISLDEKKSILIQSEDKLKTYLADNLDYALLYDYYVKTKGDATKEYSIADKKLDSMSSSDLFKFCFTYHILNDSRFMLIKEDLMGLIRDLNIIDIATAATAATADAAAATIRGKQIQDALKAADFYIIARYNHNNNVVLPSLPTILSLVRTKANETAKSHLGGIISGTNKEKMTEIGGYHDTAIDTFRTTIKIYKEIYDIYYSYFIFSILITNFFVFYAILVFLYLLIKIALYANNAYVEDGYNTYYFFQSLMKPWMVFLFTVYYFITCPIIIFGFN